MVGQYDPVQEWRANLERTRHRVYYMVSGIRHSGTEKHFNEERATGYENASCSGHWVAKLALAQIDDACDLLSRGKEGGRYGRFDVYAAPKRTAMGWKFMEVEHYWETVYWVWLERDDLGERPFSLDWCCNVLSSYANVNLTADMIRFQLQRAGLRPSRPRRKPRPRKIYVRQGERA